jgi:hypothetical protein
MIGWMIEIAFLIEAIRDVSFIQKLLDESRHTGLSRAWNAFNEDQSVRAHPALSLSCRDPAIA